MVESVSISNQANITYSERDGNPISDNTKQFRWIVVIKENLELLFADNANIFVAGDLLWYPIEGDNKTRQASDVMIVFGRAKGDRGSYGDKFLTFVELGKLREIETKRANKLQEQLQQEKEQRKRLEDKLRELGIDINDV